MIRPVFGWGLLMSRRNLIAFGGLAMLCVALAVAAPARAEEAPNRQECVSAQPRAVPGFESAEVKEQPAPIYPSAALDAWSEGWVLLECAVTSGGVVRDIAIVRD
jgi:outer membrane biosynthesis protein TonB